MNELHEVTAISKHDRCFSKSVFGMTGVGCKCKYDTMETRVVGTNNLRNWQFPKGRCPFVVGQQATDDEITRVRTTNAITAFEEEKNKKKTDRNKEVRVDTNPQ